MNLAKTKQSRHNQGEHAIRAPQISFLPFHLFDIEANL